MTFLPRYVDLPDHRTPLYARGDGAGASADEPVSEEKTIPPGHGSGEFDITEIAGVIIAKFSFVTIAGRGITWDFGSGVAHLAIRLSDDAGTTFISGSGDYRSIWYTDTDSDFSDQGYMKVEIESGGNFSLLLKNLNALMPTSLVAHGLSTAAVDPTRWAGMTLLSNTIHDAIQVAVIQGGTPPELTGGILDLVGYR